MKELEVGDKVWVECEVIDISGPVRPVLVRNGAASMWVDKEDCRLVEQSLTTETDPPITKEDVSVVDRYCELVRSQSDFAWTIFANLSVMAQDAGAPSKEANERAADLMKSWFSLNIREFEQWKQGTVHYQVAEPEVVKQPLTTEPEAKQPTSSKHYYGPDISKVTFQFTQTPNTLGTTDPTGEVGSEDITIDCEYQLPGEEPFFVIQSYSGWSFDDPELFYHLLLSVKEAEEKCRCSLLPR
jgi:hypothetical protein